MSMRNNVARFTQVPRIYTYAQMYYVHPPVARDAMMEKVYLDYNATTPLASEVLNAITAALRDAWGNPSSSYHAGVTAKQCITEARSSVAQMINVATQDIVFTSGGTESNNMVMDTVARHYQLVHSEDGENHSLPHVVISNLEHDSIDVTARKMEELGRIELSVVKANPKTGAVDEEEVVSALRPNTVLVSVMLANNETGVIQPVAKITKAVRRWQREMGGKNKVFIHTDAAQALGKIAVDATELGVDYLTIVGHKFYGPRIGALYVRGLEQKLVPLYPMLYGGGQERGYRSGTENTGMIAGLGAAAQLVTDNVDKYCSHMREIRNYLEEQLENVFQYEVHFNGRFPGSERIPNTCNVSVVGAALQGHRVLSLLERCQASVGAACHSHDGSKPSPVLTACGIPEEVAINAMRLSVGRETTKKDIDTFIADLSGAVRKLLEH